MAALAAAAGRRLSPAAPEDRVHSFPPQAGPWAAVLVLGSMPGVASLEAVEYYAHPRNAFWDAVACLGIPRSQPYADRCAAFNAQGFALWDVLADCRRAGSLDGAIRDAHANDFGGFADAHPELSAIVFNGKKAREVWDRQVDFPRSDVELISMPSTSPANTRKAKLGEWQRLLRRLAPSAAPR